MVQLVNDAVEDLYRSDWGRIVATLIGIVGDFDLAEECAQEAFVAAVHQWQETGIPEFPRAWIVKTAHHKAIDRLRRRTLHDEKIDTYAKSGMIREFDEPDYEAIDIPDDRLRLMFTCCHPALALEAQIALTLRTLCGLETEEIARAFLVPTATMAQRLVRAKRKIRHSKIPYRVPEASEIGERLDAVLTVIYLVFNEGYAATSGSNLVRTDLCAEAIRLARTVRALMTPNPPTEVTGLLALMLLHDSRRDARLDEVGDIIVLEEQDRSRWNRDQIREALPLVAEAFSRGPGPFTIQAGIAAMHCQAPRFEDTDWAEILRMYDMLIQMDSSPVVALNRAVAVAMAKGPGEALAIIDTLAEGELKDYHLLHAAKADLLRRIGSSAEAAKSYLRAIELATNESERRYLQRRLDECRRAGTHA